MPRLFVSKAKAPASQSAFRRVQLCPLPHRPDRRMVRISSAKKNRLIFLDQLLSGSRIYPVICAANGCPAENIKIERGQRRPSRLSRPMLHQQV
jgi:hypothetical protein